MSMRFVGRLLILFVFGITLFGSVETVSAAANPDGSVTINEENFPDPNFRKSLEKAEGIDQNRNGVLEREELEQVKSIDVGDGLNDFRGADWQRGEYTLEGIEYFQNLESITVSEVFDLKGSIPPLPKLTKIYIDVWSRTLDFKSIKSKLPLSRIRALHLGVICVENLDLSGLSHLEEFSVRESDGTDYMYPYLVKYRGTLDFSPNRNLKKVDIYGMQLRKLNLSKNSQLEELCIHGGQMRILDVSRNRRLRKLEVGNRQLADIKLPAQSEIEEIDLAAPNAVLDVTSCTGILKYMGKGVSSATVKVRMGNKVFQKFSRGNKLRFLRQKYGVSIKRKQLAVSKKRQCIYIKY